MTDKQIIIAIAFGETRFRKDNGREVGGSEYRPRKLLVATDELIAEIELEQKIAKLSDLKFRFHKGEKQLVEQVYEFLKSKDLIK